MEASAQDQLLKVASNTGWQLDASGISDAAVTSFGLVSATGLPTTTAVILTVDRVNSSGVATPTKMERIKGIVSGTNVISCTRGFEGTAQAHAAGAVVEIVISAGLWNSMIDGTDTHKATEKITPVDADELGLVDSAASNVLKKLTWANLKATLKTYLDTLYPPQNGWISYSTVTPTRASADDPTYVLTFAGADLTSTISVGMRLKWTQNATTRYGIVTAISFSTNTTLTLYGGTDYDVDDTATYAISAFHYSTMKAPLGFPMDPLKWRVETLATSSQSQASPVTNTWYNVGSNNIIIPIGSWHVSFQATLFLYQTAATTINGEIALSTANNSASDADLKSYTANGGASGTMAVYGTVNRVKRLSVASKTTYYLNVRSVVSAATVDIKGDLASTIIRAECAYL